MLRLMERLCSDFESVGDKDLALRTVQSQVDEVHGVMQDNVRRPHRPLRLGTHITYIGSSRSQDTRRRSWEAEVTPIYVCVCLHTAGQLDAPQR